MKKQKKGILGKIASPILSYKRYWSYYSSTSRNLIPLLNKNNFSELTKTFMDVKSPKKTFQESMQREGIVEEDLPKIYNRLRKFLWISLVFDSYLFYMVFKYIISKTAIIPFLYTFTVLAPLLISGLFYFLCSWMMWKIRNKMDIEPMKYIKIIKKFPYQLYPFIGFKEKMSSRYGKNWNKKRSKNDI